jgi:hypothetical protein
VVADRVPIATRVPFSGASLASGESTFARKNLPYGYRAANSAPQARPRAGQKLNKKLKKCKKIAKNVQKVKKTG